MSRQSSNLVGQRFGNVLVTKKSDRTDKWKHSFWECQCDCGKVTTARQSQLLSGEKVSCYACWTKNDLTGLIFGSLVVIEFSHSNDGRYWKCLCNCGNECIASTGQLVHQSKKTCANVNCKYRLGKDNGNWKGYGEITSTYWKCAQNSALTRNIYWDLSIEYGWDLFLKQHKKCALSGIELKFTRSITRDRDSQTASLDRINNLFGYVEGNVQWVHKFINYFKSDVDNNKFIDICHLVSKNNKVDEQRLSQLITDINKPPMLYHHNRRFKKIYN